MFPDETHVKILQDIDNAEMEAHRQYLRLESLRLRLQEQWKVMPNGERWTQERHDASAHSRKR